MRPQLATAMRISRFSVNQLVNNRRNITAEMAIRLGKALNTSPEFWLNLQRRYDLFVAGDRLRDEVGSIRQLVDDTPVTLHDLG